MVSAAVELTVNVNVMVPPAGAETLPGVAEAVIPEGAAFAARPGSSTPVAPPAVVTAIEKLPVVPRWMVSVVAEGFAEAPSTCTVMVLETVRPPPVAVTVMLYVPGVTVAPWLVFPAVTVSVDVPLLDEFSVTGLLLHEAVRLEGNPLTLRAIVPLNEPPPVKETTWLATLWLALTASVGLMTVMVLEAGVTVKVGTVAIVVKLTWWLPLTPSPVAVTVIVAVPDDTDDEAVSVSVDFPLSEVSVTGLALHEAVTPLGSPLTLIVAAPL